MCILCICCNVWVQALTRTHPRRHLFSNNWQLAAVLDKCHIIFNVIHWRCDLNPLLNHSTIKSLPYWSAKGLLLIQKVVWFWSFFWKNWYTFNSLTPVFLIDRWWSGGFKDLCYQRIIQILGGPCLNTCALAVILWKNRETSLTAVMQCWCSACLGKCGERTRVRGTRGAGCSSAAPSPPTGRSGSVSRWL